MKVPQHPESINPNVRPLMKYAPPEVAGVDGYPSRWIKRHVPLVTPVQAGLIAELIGFDTEGRHHA